MEGRRTDRLTEGGRLRPSAPPEIFNTEPALSLFNPRRGLLFFPSFPSFLESFDASFSCEPRASQNKSFAYTNFVVCEFSVISFSLQYAKNPPFAILNEFDKKKTVFFVFKTLCYSLLFFSLSLFCLQKLKMSKWEIGQSVAPVMHSNFSSVFLNNFIFHFLQALKAPKQK